MMPDPKIGCPMTGFARSCRDVQSQWDCPKYIHVIGLDPQTGQHIDKYGCNEMFQHMLQIETAKEVRQTAAAIESFRNEVVMDRHKPVHIPYTFGQLLTIGK